LFVGVGAARVRDLFQQAKAKAPCIIFIDELDAIGKSRAQALSVNDEREQTLNQLLVEMDGFDARTGVIILAATNRPEVLDPALLRPGRFDRQVLMDKPDLNGREAILLIHSHGVRLDESVSLREVAKRTAGFVGADLANLVNEAAILAVRAGRQKVAQTDFEAAFEKLVAGLEKKNRLINPKERRIVAYHETGHALVAHFTPGVDPVEKISIVPRGIAALGYTMQLPTEDRYLMTEGELNGRIDVLLGGRAAEQLVFHEVSTGASNDLDKAGEIARRMITDYGMSDKFRNTFLPMRRQGQLMGGANELAMKEYSEATQQYVDEESAKIIKTRYENVSRLLGEHQGLLREIAEKLIEVETLEKEQFESLVRGSAPKQGG
jgi:cell division protease FtsH